MPDQINKKTSISLNLAFSLVAIAFAAGILWMKIDNFDQRLAQLENKVGEIHDFIQPKLALNNQ